MATGTLYVHATLHQLIPNAVNPLVIACPCTDCANKYTLILIAKYILGGEIILFPGAHYLFMPN